MFGVRKIRNSSSEKNSGTTTGVLWTIANERRKLPWQALVIRNEARGIDTASREKAAKKPEEIAENGKQCQFNLVGMNIDLKMNSPRLRLWPLSTAAAHVHPSQTRNLQLFPPGQRLR